MEQVCLETTLPRIWANNNVYHANLALNNSSHVSLWVTLKGIHY